MKKFLILIVLLALGFGTLYYMRGDNEGATTQNDSGDKVFRPDPKSATFKFDDNSITLSDGKSLEKDGNIVLQETELLDERAHGDLNKDGKEDTATYLDQAAFLCRKTIMLRDFCSTPQWSNIYSYLILQARLLTL